MEEIWKDIAIEPWGEFYQVSNLGRVRSKDRMNYAFNAKSNTYTYFKKNGKMLIPYQNKVGYLTIKLSVENVKKTFTLHRLIAMTFILGCNIEESQVNHIDGNKQNNHISNLEWCSARENMLHARANNLLVTKKLGQSAIARKVAQIDKNTNEVIKVWDCIKSATISFGRKTSSISSVCKGQKSYNTAYGFKWQYV